MSAELSPYHRTHLGRHMNCMLWDLENYLLECLSVQRSPEMERYVPVSGFGIAGSPEVALLLEAEAIVAVLDDKRE